MAKRVAAAEGAAYRTLDDASMRQIAQSDPNGFVAHDGRMMVIDEVQRVPALLSSVKMRVDENDRPGQYLLTGSADIQSLPGTQESLAGRIRKIRLRPLAQCELRGNAPNFLDAAFDVGFSASFEQCDRAALSSMAFAGGFPEALRLEGADRREWHKDYIDALIERDLRDVAHIQRQDSMRELVRALAAWSGKFIDVSAVGSGLAIRRPTVESYVNALEAMYLVERVKPWTKTDYARVGKHDKIFMTDTGLMAAVLGWRKEEVYMDADRFGKLIESFAFGELAAQIDAGNGKYALFHYRDREKREIDFIVERDDGALLGIEIKSGSAVSSGDCKHLRWFKDNIAKDRPFKGIVLYSGEISGTIAENVQAVPFSALWS